MMRQICKQILTIVAALGLTAAAWLGLALAAQADGLVTTIVTDPLTGIAIDGYDPVSYFIDPEPKLGQADFEYDWAGVPWYFESAANRDVFARNPTVYAPQFGGHCLMSLSRGYISDGKPRLYAIDGVKLYFFYSAANRDAFLLSKQQAVADATNNWPTLSRGLTGPEGETPASAGLAVANAEPAPVAAGQTDATVQSN